MIPRIEQHRDEIAELCRRFGVSRLEVFGSAATGAFREGESDIDFLVEFEDRGWKGLSDRYFGLKEGLEELFGVSVDLVMEDAIQNPHFRAAVNESRTPLYAA